MQKMLKFQVFTTHLTENDVLKTEVAIILLFKTFFSWTTKKDTIFTFLGEDGQDDMLICKKTDLFGEDKKWPATPISITTLIT